MKVTGCPAHAKAIPPHVADNMTTTRSDINLQYFIIHKVQDSWQVKLRFTQRDLHKRNTNYRDKLLT